MASQVDICNRALGFLGIRQYIEALTDDTEEAQACSVIYDSVLEETLAAYEWPFATQRATLAALADVSREGWEYAYTLPSDCLVPLRIWSGARRPRNDDRVPFTIEDNDGTPILLSDELSPELHFIARHENPTSYPPGFVKALAWALAAELALHLEAKRDLADWAARQAELAIQRAAAQSYNGTQADPEPDSEFISGRE